MLDTLLLVFMSMIVAFGCGWTARTWVRRDQPKTAEDVRDAVHRAFLAAGLPDTEFEPSFDLLRAGKLQQVYHVAARSLGKDPEWSTVEDVMRDLSA